MLIRIGQGYDVHQLSTGYSLVIGGVDIPNEKGSKGHSDGDVLYHAVVDALLGAISAGDIGSYFPSSDERWRGADSSVFLKHAWQMVKSLDFEIANVDSTIILQSPRLADHILKMRQNLAGHLELKMNQVSVKATTTDHLGFSGRGEGLAAQATILLSKQI